MVCLILVSGVGLASGDCRLDLADLQSDPGELVLVTGLPFGQGALQGLFVCFEGLKGVSQFGLTVGRFASGFGNLCLDRLFFLGDQGQGGVPGQFLVVEFIFQGF